MNDYVIFTDADSDMTQQMVDDWGVVVQPMRFSMDGEEYNNYPDAREMSIPDFYVRLRAGAKTSTTQTNTSEYAELFRTAMRQGKNALYIGFSSGLSGTVNAAALAKDELQEEFPGRTLVVVDTLSASLGQALLVQQASKMKTQGKSMAEVANWLVENRKKVCHWFTVDDLQFLRRGGRLSAGAALMGGVLSIKPILRVNNEGKLEPVDKVRGRKNSLLRLVDEMAKTAVDPGDRQIYIAHADCLDDALFVEEAIKKRFEATNTTVTHIGPVVGGHAGPGTLAVFYMGSGRD